MLHFFSVPILRHTLNDETLFGQLYDQQSRQYMKALVCAASKQARCEVKCAEEPTAKEMGTGNTLGQPEREVELIGCNAEGDADRKPLIQQAKREDLE